MDRWTGILRSAALALPSPQGGGSHFKVAASLCLSSTSGTLAAPSTNAVFFTGDRVRGTGTGNRIIEELSESANIARLLVSKLGVRGEAGAVNAWVVDAACFSGPFAVYREFVPSVDSLGNPARYEGEGFPASTSIVALLSDCVRQARDIVTNRRGLAATNMDLTTSVSSFIPRTILLGFSKGGIILNQILAEIASLDPKTADPCLGIRNSSAASLRNEDQFFPGSKNCFLQSISEFHYIDVGLNCPGAYLTDHTTIKKVADHICHCGDNARFVVHGTPRQWFDMHRPWIFKEKERLLELLEEEAQRTGGKIGTKQRLYFEDRSPSLEMHFEIIKEMDLS
ncbi:hypothetical protein Taro_006586 [Colocasia esculenta]|uniref:Uncharacterized protein n=1 Tax=Colocasia esculenta TaxID=4460 RepID=A0A843U194_COLES|nr:hypothetical protein [Colocasia esculenta]